MIVKMMKNLENKMEKMHESINKDLEELKNKHTETNNTITEIKNTLEGINSRISEAEEWISELEDKIVEITSEEQNKVKRMKRTEDSLRDLWDNITCTNIQIIGVPEEEERKKEYEKFFEEIIVENFPNMEKESQSSPRSTKSPIQDKSKEKHGKTHTKLTKTKYKERILKAARVKQQVTYKKNPKCLTADLSAENLQAWREWQDIFKVLKGKNLQPRLLQPESISFKTDGEIKS